MEIIKTYGDFMSLNPADFNSPEIYTLFNQMILELQSEKRGGNTNLVSSFIHDKLADLAKMGVLNSRAIEGIEDRCRAFKDKQIKQLSSQDFQVLENLFEASLHDSGYEDLTPATSRMLSNAIRVFKQGTHPNARCFLKECIAELQDPVLKRELIEFISKKGLDPTAYIDQIPKKLQQELVGFLERKLQKEMQRKAVQESPKACLASLCRYHVIDERKHQSLAAEAPNVRKEIEAQRLGICAQSLQDARHDLLTIAESIEDLELTLRTREVCELEDLSFPIVQQVAVDLMGVSSRASYMDVKFPHSIFMQLHNHHNIHTLFHAIDFFSKDILPPGVSQEQKERFLKIVSFLCTQHLPNGFLYIFRGMLNVALVSINDSFATELKSVHLMFKPVYDASGKIQPLRFEIHFDSVLDVRPSLSFKDVPQQEREHVELMLAKLGLGPFSPFNVSANLVVDCSEVNPTVNVTDYQIR